MRGWHRHAITIQGEERGPPLTCPRIIQYEAFILSNSNHQHAKPKIWRRALQRALGAPVHFMDSAGRAIARYWPQPLKAPHDLCPSAPLTLCHDPRCRLGSVSLHAVQAALGNKCRSLG